ncbi:MAG TPA: AMP-binding protein [Iamia sp.]
MTPWPQNLSALIAERASSVPDQPFGMVGSSQTLGSAVSVASRAAATFAALGVGVGDRVAVIGTNSDAYLVDWLALQLAGAEPSLINPTYPADLLRMMLADLDPRAVVWVGPDPDVAACPGVVHVDARGIDEGWIVVDGVSCLLAGAASDLPGLGRAPSDGAGSMHTSGTTGTPKFCVQSHEYFLRLGRFVADTMGIHGDDTVLAPLPLFHINPLGYGVIGGLTARAGVLSMPRFSASKFWPDVVSSGASVLVLHAPPVEILKRSSDAADAAGHRVRIVFFADNEFLDTFDIPMGVSAYGSTEAGGLCHTWTWRRGDVPVDLPEGMSRYGGRARPEVQWAVDPVNGEILLRADRPHVLFEGYYRDGRIDPALDDEGWFATGDIGRVDTAGNLVFVERAAESIRVKGEYVPIGFVEDHFSSSGLGFADLAIWRADSDLVDHEVALYVVAPALDAAALRAAAAELPTFMRPAVVLRVDAIPRDDGVGKVRRRQLDTCTVLERVAL